MCIRKERDTKLVYNPNTGHLLRFGKKAEFIFNHSAGLSDSDGWDEDTLARVHKSINQLVYSGVQSWNGSAGQGKLPFALAKKMSIFKMHFFFKGKKRIMNQQNKENPTCRSAFVRFVSLFHCVPVGKKFHLLPIIWISLWTNILQPDWPICHVSKHLRPLLFKGLQFAPWSRINSWTLLSTFLYNIFFSLWWL